MKYTTLSDIETVKTGEKLGEILTGGDVVALSGSLGSGKTWFTKGIGLGLGVDRDEVITSPSFSLVNEYKGRYDLYHMDLYRLDTLADVIAIGIEEYFNENSVVVIEWAERCLELLPLEFIRVNIDILDENKRSIDIVSKYHGI